MNSNDETKQINNLNNCIMKQFTLKSLMLLLLLLIGGGSYAWGEEKTAQFGADWNALFGTSYTGTFNPRANTLNLSGTVNTVGIAVANGASTNGFVKTSDFRAYKGYTISFTAPEGNNITAIASIKGGKAFTNDKCVTADCGNLTIKDNAINWTGSANAVKLAISGTVSFNTITVTYTTSGGGTPTTPSLNVNTTSVDFGTVEQNAAVEAKTVSVSLKNVTSANVKLTGEGASAFEVSPAVLTASGNVTITPKTTTVGTYTAKLEISADGAETQSVDVSMTVREPFDGSVWEIKGTDLPGTSYAACDGEHGPVRGFKFYTKDVLKNNQSDYKGQFQFRRKPTGFLYNTTSFSNIVKIELETSSTFTVYVGKAEHPEAQEVKGTSANGVITYYIPEGNGYFTIKNGDKTGYISSIKVYYSISPSEPTYTANTLTFKASNKEGNWATFSNDDVTFFNDDVIVNTVVVENNSLVSLALDKTTANIGGKEVTGYYVPAKTGVLIYSIGKTVTYYVVKNKEVEPVDGGFNMLKPASEQMTEGFKYYKLAYDNYTEKSGLGFYWGAAEGGAFTVKPGLAYLAVPQAQAANVKGFSFDGTQTGINGVEATTAKGAIYNLNGQRVEKAQRGIYIQNGKKFIVK